MLESLVVQLPNQPQPGPKRWRGEEGGFLPRTRRLRTLVIGAMTPVTHLYSKAIYGVTV